MTSTVTNPVLLRTVHVEKSFGEVPSSVAEFDEACDVTLLLLLLPMLFVQKEETTELIDQRRVYSHMISHDLVDLDNHQSQSSPSCLSDPTEQTQSSRGPIDLATNRIPF